MKVVYDSKAGTISEAELFEARLLVSEKPSTSYVQRRMLIGYNRASLIMEMLEAEGLISERNSAGLRIYLGKTESNDDGTKTPLSPETNQRGPT